MFAALRCGALGIAFLSGGYGKDELERAGAMRVFDDPADMLLHLDELARGRAPSRDGRQTPPGLAVSPRWTSRVSMSNETRSSRRVRSPWRHFRPSSNGTISRSTSISRRSCRASFTAAARGSLLLTLGGFAIAYLMRPLGALFFSHIGDRRGRRHMMLMSVAMMTAAMLATALLPTRTAVGPAAGWLLLPFAA